MPGGSSGGSAAAVAAQLCAASLDPCYRGVYLATGGVLRDGRVEAKLRESFQARVVGVRELVRLHRTNHVERGRRCGDINGRFVW